jgi:CheY-like chemotaxis protein
MLFQAPETPNTPPQTQETLPLAVNLTAKPPQTILLVDDDTDFPLLVTRAIKLLKPRPLLHYVPSAFQAQDYLVGRHVFGDRSAYPLPDLILLDLKMPILNGFQFLEWVRAKPEFKKLSIFVLTDSINPRDLTRAYQLGANSFLVKPSDVDELIGPLKTLLGLP